MILHDSNHLALFITFSFHVLFSIVVLIAVEMPSVLLMAAVRNVQIVCYLFLSPIESGFLFSWHVGSLEFVLLQHWVLYRMWMLIYILAIVSRLDLLCIK